MFNSTDVSREFGILHKHLMELIRKDSYRLQELADKMFTLSEYTSLQNKKLPMYIISEDGLKLLMNNRSLSKNHTACLKYLEKFGDRASVVIRSKSRFEDDYYETLCDFVGSKNIIRQYPIAGFRVDFFIDPGSVFIEFDEEQHLSTSHRKSDSDRWEIINKEYKSLTGCDATLIRVEKGGEIKSLAMLAGFLSLNAAHFMISHTGCESKLIHTCK